jgi:hypothetical protein
MDIGGSLCLMGEPVGNGLLLPFPSCLLYNPKSGKPVALPATCFQTSFLLGFFFDPEDGCDMVF